MRQLFINLFMQFWAIILPVLAIAVVLVFAVSFGVIKSCANSRAEAENRSQQLAQEQSAQEHKLAMMDKQAEINRDQLEQATTETERLALLEIQRQQQAATEAERLKLLDIQRQREAGTEAERLKLIEIENQRQAAADVERREQRQRDEQRKLEAEAEAKRVKEEQAAAERVRLEHERRLASYIAQPDRTNDPARIDIAVIVTTGQKLNQARSNEIASFIRKQADCDVTASLFASPIVTEGVLLQIANGDRAPLRELNIPQYVDYLLIISETVETANSTEIADLIVSRLNTAGVCINTDSSELTSSHDHQTIGSGVTAANALQMALDRDRPVLHGWLESISWLPAE